MNEIQTPFLPGGLIGYWDRASDAEWAEVLSAFPLFSRVAKRTLRKLVRHASFAEYGPGDIVIAKDAPGDSLYIILSGTAKARGKPAARTLRIGDYFGELGLFGGVPRSATVVAMGELHLMKLSRQSFLRLAQHKPEISLQMLTNLGNQIRQLEMQPAPA